MRNRRRQRLITQIPVNQQSKNENENKVTVIVNNPSHDYSPIPNSPISGYTQQ